MMRGNAAPPDPGLRHDDKRQTREKPFCFPTYQGRGEALIMCRAWRQRATATGPARTRSGLAANRQRVRVKEDSRQLAVLDYCTRH